MSHKATAWAFAQQLPALQKLVLIVLADRHNGCTGRCDITFDTLAIMCGLNHNETLATITMLEKDGLVIPSEDGVILRGVQ